MEAWLKMTSVFADETYITLSKAGKNLVDEHAEAIEHFRTNLPKDYKNYRPPEGYRYYKYHWSSGRGVTSPVPRVGQTVSLKGEFVTLLAKKKAQFIHHRKKRKSRSDYIVSVLLLTVGKDPNTRCNPRFLWENWEDKKVVKDD